MEYDPNEALKLSNQLCFPLYAASRKITGAYTPYLKPLGLTYTQYIVLLALWEQDGISVGELCEKLMLDNGTMTPLLKRMEQNGILTRARSQQDERMVLIFLTERGQALKKQAKYIPLQVAGCVHLSQEEAMQLYTLLYEILDQGKDG